MSRNYQPANWPGDDMWSGIGGRSNDTMGGHTQMVRVPHDQTESTFVDRRGRKCRIVCDPPPRPDRNQPNLQRIGRMMIGKTIYEARSIYPHVREVIRDGQQLATTMDHRPDRINVETRNGVIIRINGFY